MSDVRVGQVRIFSNGEHLRWGKQVLRGKRFSVVARRAEMFEIVTEDGDRLLCSSVTIGRASELLPPDALDQAAAEADND